LTVELPAEIRTAEPRDVVPAPVTTADAAGQALHG
jgi:hypothetical protein